VKIPIATFASAISLLLALPVTAETVEPAKVGLEIEIVPRFGAVPLTFDVITNRTIAGQRISVTRLDFLVSDFALQRANGSWFESKNSVAYVSGRDGRTSFRLSEIPKGAYERIRFHVGLPAEINHRDPTQFPADHPLNPQLNGLHWGWAGGYVFLALEGNWFDAAGRQSGFSYHIATDRCLMTVELLASLDLSSNGVVALMMDVDGVFNRPNQVMLSDESNSSHSRPNDPIAQKLRENVQSAFEVIPGRAPGFATSKTSQQHIEVAANATAYPFSFASYFPQPALPRDNPLTREAVELGRRLFFETRLSINNCQSCGSCHEPARAFSSNEAVSRGAEGSAGSRNAMPLLNLAWRASFFWDGRASSLRKQVLQPIQNPMEMHESLTNVIAKLNRSNAPASILGSSDPNSEDCSIEAGAQKVRVLTPHPNPLPVRGEGIASNDVFIRVNKRRYSLSPHGERVGVRGESPIVPTTTAAAETDYPLLFRAAFGTPEISSDRIARALEQFLLVQTADDSKFDRVLRGEAELTAEEQRGFELFHTEYDPRHEQFGADCFHCHGGPLFQSQTFANNGLDLVPKDLGRYEVTKQAGDNGKFAVPSLRNVELTAPYMHDGRFQTLEEVVQHYASGVKRSATLDPNLGKHPDGGVPLTVEDKRALVAFLKTLTDERLRPQPAFAGLVKQHETNKTKGQTQ
jgi:cytochrome c peroxidase